MVMMMTKFICLFSAAALLISAPATVQAEAVNNIDWKSGGVWSDLSAYIGTYHYDSVLNDTRIAQALMEQLGEDALQALKDNIGTRAPIGFEDDCLLLSGNAPSAGDTHAAFVAVCLYKGVVHTALRQGNELTLYTAAGQYDFLPYALKMWVYGQKNQDVFKLPDGVTLKLAP